MNVDTSIGGNHNGGKIGAVSIGRYYDMPHSPDLNLKLTYEYDGVKNITTKGGSILSNASYTKPADWGDGGAWQLSSTLADGSQSAIPSNLRSGRRVWDLSFSYISDTDMFPTSSLGGGVITDPDNYGTYIGIVPVGANLWDAAAGAFTVGGSPDGGVAYTEEETDCYGWAIHGSSRSPSRSR